MQTPTRSPGRALLKTPSRMQPHVQIESFAPALPATIFASDPSLRALINRDTSNIDFSLRTLQQTIIDRNRSFKAKLHDFVIEGKKIEKQTAELAEQQRVLENLLAKEKGEAETGGQKVKVLEGRRKDMQAQLDSLKADIAEWQAKINLNMQSELPLPPYPFSVLQYLSCVLAKKVLEEEIAQQQAKNKPEVELFEEVLGLQIRGKSRNLISIIFTKIDPNSYSRRFSFDLDLSRTQYTG